jgi:bacteriocin-like protein
MSEQKPVENNATDETKKPSNVPLNEEELQQVNGGEAINNGTYISKIIIEL